MRYTLVLAALATLAACNGEPRDPATDAMVWQMWGANNARYQQMRQPPARTDCVVLGAYVSCYGN